MVPSLHSTSASPTYPGGQRQAMVRSGSVSTTEHSANLPHGVVSTHGFLQAPLKQASLLEQSASIRHSGSASIITANIKMTYNIRNFLVLLCLLS